MYIIIYTFCYLTTQECTIYKPTPPPIPPTTRIPIKGQPQKRRAALTTMTFTPQVFYSLQSMWCQVSSYLKRGGHYKLKLIIAHVLSTSLSGLTLDNVGYSTQSRDDCVGKQTSGQ